MTKLELNYLSELRLSMIKNQCTMFFYSLSKKELSCTACEKEIYLIDCGAYPIEKIKQIFDYITVEQ